MVQIHLQLIPNPDDSVRIAADPPSGTREFVAAAPAVAAVRRSAQSLMEGFESSHAPLADPVQLAELGRLLRDTFLAGLEEEILASLAVQPTRLLFQSSEPALLNLPWELLPGRNGGFLVADTRCLIRRTTRETLPPASLPLVAPPLRILFTACAPIDQAGLDFEREEEAMLRIAHKLGARIHLDFAEAGTFDELRELIDAHKPHIVHLSGHGIVINGVGTFAFENDRGRSDSRDARQMAEQLFAGRGVRLVFVNGCQTSQAAIAGVCQTLTATGHVPFALGWGASIADGLATEFARIFYQEVATQPVDLAMAIARRELLERCKVKLGNTEVFDASFALPQLYAGDTAEAIVDHSLPRQTPERPGVRHALLGDNIRGLLEGFVGRRRLLQRTRPALRNGDKTVLLLTGIGGAGKSTLATRLANRFVQDGYRIAALRAEREQAETFCLRLVSEIAVACQRLGCANDEKTLLDGGRPLPNRLRLAVEILNETPILLVLDNLEALLPPPPAAPVWIFAEFADFLAALTGRLTGQGRAILTCRYVPAGFDATQPNLAHEAMPDFTEGDFIKYLRRHARVAERMEQGKLSKELLQSFHKKLGATPRFVEQACAILGTLDPDAIGEQLAGLAAPPAGTEGDSLWQLQQAYFRDLFLPQLYDALSPAHRLALSRFAVVQEPISTDGLALVTGLELQAAKELTSHGVALSLLQRIGEEGETDLFAVYPLQRDFFLAPERLAVSEHKAAHGAAAAFFQDCFEKDRENELRLSWLTELYACLHHAEHAGDLIRRIWATNKLAWRLIRLAEYRAALAMAEALLTESRHPDLLAIAARCHLNTGHWARGRSLYMELLRARQAVDDRTGEATAWHNLASIDLNEGNHAEARQNFQKALTMLQAVGDPAGEAGTRHQLATIDLREGNYAEARKNFQKALTMRQAIGDRAGEAATWHQLASTDVLEGNYAEARKNFQKALIINQDIGDRAAETAVWHNLATIDLREGNYAQARQNLQKAHTINQAIGDRAAEARTQHQFASIDLNEGNFAQARQNFLKALIINQAIGDRAGEAATRHQLATLDINEGKYAQGCQNFQKALAICQTIGDRAGEAATLFQLGCFAWKIHRGELGIRLAAICFLIERAIGSGGVKETVEIGLAPMASELGLDESSIDTLLADAWAHYQRDRGAELIRQACADLPPEPSDNPPPAATT